MLVLTVCCVKRLTYIALVNGDGLALKRRLKPLSPGSERDRALPGAYTVKFLRPE